MTDIEKVIKGLTCCISTDKCYECPYKDEQDEIYSGFCEQVLKHDTLVLLKEHEKIYHNVWMPLPELLKEGK